jgi:hypothetical protein
MERKNTKLPRIFIISYFDPEVIINLQILCLIWTQKSISIWVSHTLEICVNVV